MLRQGPGALPSRSRRNLRRLLQGRHRPGASRTACDDHGSRCCGWALTTEKGVMAARRSGLATDEWQTRATGATLTARGVSPTVSLCRHGRLGPRCVDGRAPTYWKRATPQCWELRCRRQRSIDPMSRDTPRYAVSLPCRPVLTPRRTQHPRGRAQEHHQQRGADHQVRPSRIEQPHPGRREQHGKALVHVVARALPRG